jgi:ribosomal protein S14
MGAEGHERRDCKKLDLDRLDFRELAENDMTIP